MDWIHNKIMDAALVFHYYFDESSNIIFNQQSIYSFFMLFTFFLCLYKDMYWIHNKIMDAALVFYYYFDEQSNIIFNQQSIYIYIYITRSIEFKYMMFS